MDKRLNAHETTHPAATGQVEVVGGFKVVAAVVLAQLCTETDRRYAVAGVVLAPLFINVIDFMESEGYFLFKADYSISSKEFYDIYKQWCEDNACHSVSAIRFSAELRQNDRRYNLEATNNIYLPGGRRVRGFVGIEPLVHPCP